jgi:hypothetical protein
LNEGCNYPCKTGSDCLKVEIPRFFKNASLSLSLKETSHPPFQMVKKMGLMRCFNEAVRILFCYCIITFSNFFCIINISLLMSVVGNVNGTELVLDLDQAPNLGIKGFASLENHP